MWVQELAMVGSPTKLPEQFVPAPIHDRAEHHVSVLGAGYVGLPTAVALFAAGYSVTAVEPDERRRAEIASGTPDTDDLTLASLREGRSDDRFDIACGPDRLSESDLIIICVPTPIDHNANPDERFIQAACQAVVAQARSGQTIVQTSTAGVGATRRLLVEPLEARGLTVGTDVFVAFSPERIDPGNSSYAIRDVPRLLGGATKACTEAAAIPMSALAPLVRVSSLEVAELAKLHENTFRAVNIALVNELAEVARGFEVDPSEVLEAADTKPFGFMRFNPGPGAGGHCIPCDPHYLLASAQERMVPMPLTAGAMSRLAERPIQVANGIIEAFAQHRAPVNRVLVVGVAYKPNVRDTRESPAIRIIEHLLLNSLEVDYFDPLVESIQLSDGRRLRSADPLARYDAVVVCTLHDEIDIGEVTEGRLTIDTTYSLRSAPIDQ